MKKIPIQFILLFAALLGVVSCGKDDDEGILENEYRYIRVLVSDETSSTLSLVEPESGTVENFSAEYAKPALHTTGSQRFAAIIHRDQNMTETFDVGMEWHGDHVATVGTPKFGVMTGESNLPTHFKSKNGKLMTFNDGDGTLSVGREADIHTSEAMFETIDAGLLAHHGAMAIFDNGSYAVTEKDNTVEGALPEKVKIIDSDGTTLHEASISTTGIHGNASDGSHAVFGSSSGMLVVESDGSQRLIPHPDGFGTAWFGTILPTSSHGKFVAYTASKGAYLIDVETDMVTPVVESSDIMQCKVSFDKTKLGILMYSGDLSLYDLNGLQSLHNFKAIDATENDPGQGGQKPQLALTEKFAYITSPSTGELYQMHWNTKSMNQKIKVSETPSGLTLLGYETDESH